MIYKFKDAAKIPRTEAIPGGITPEIVLAELDDVEAACGKKTPELATDEVIAYPEKYPALRAFGPASPDAAFKEGIRRGITYAVRAIVEIEEVVNGEPEEIRALFLVTDSDGDEVYQTLEVIAREPDQAAELLQELRADARAFSRKLNSVLATIARIIGRP
jgi:hypothetical protein